MLLKEFKLNENCARNSIFLNSEEGRNAFGVYIFGQGLFTHDSLE